MKKNGFTLVELLAVIVILAIILVIAVPKITDTINNAREGSMASSVKMVAAAAEREKMVADTLGKDFDDTDCITAAWAGLNGSDYKTCTVSFDDNGSAKVSMTGKGKFEGYTCTNGTRTEATCTKATESGS